MIQHDELKLSIMDIINGVNDQRIEFYPLNKENEKLKSKFIESILLNFPHQSLYIFQNSKGVLKIQIGQTKIQSIIEFYNGEFELTDLKYLPDLNNKKFSELEPHVRNFFKRYIFSFHVFPVSQSQDEEKIIPNLFKYFFGSF